jgi:3',5'-cyclic AMP phosphodiesterase CpdA
MKIVHFSDMHVALPPDSLSGYFDKRLLGTLNYAFRRRFLHDQTLLKHLADFILDLNPDVAVCTGDLTSTGQPAEFQTALDFLRPILEAKNIELLYVPGNHDAYVKNKRCVASLAETFTTLNGGKITLDTLPSSQTISGIEFILINESFPTNLVLSNGTITKSTEKKLCEICSKKKRTPRILVGHFPIKPLLSRRHGLLNAAPLRKLLENESIDLSLCGHTHKPMIDINDKGQGEATAGSFTRTCDVNVIEYSPESNTFKINSVKFKR